MYFGELLIGLDCGLAGMVVGLVVVCSLLALALARWVGAACFAGFVGYCVYG